MVIAGSRPFFSFKANIFMIYTTLSLICKHLLPNAIWWEGSCFDITPSVTHLDNCKKNIGRTLQQLLACWMLNTDTYSLSNVILADEKWTLFQ